MRTALPPRLHIAVLLVVAGLTAACASSVRPGDAGDAASDVTFADSAMACVLSDGTLCAAGASCRAPDGCNTCSCSATGQHLSCTLLDCVRTCHATSECGADQVCTFHAPGCGTEGACEPVIRCHLIRPFCACDGTQHVGPCNGPDAPYTREGDCTCASNADCPDPRTECVFAPGCGPPQGFCRPDIACDEPNEFCGCDGRTFLACQPTRPLVATGACPALADAGAGRDCDSCGP